MRRSLPGSLLLLAIWLLPGPAVAPARSEEVPLLRAGDVTERGRDVDRILDLVLAPPQGETGDRTLVLLLDPTVSLQKSDFTGELSKALERHAEDLASTRIGVAVVGGNGGLVLKPTARRALVIESVRELLAHPVGHVQNVYGDVRRILPDLRREAGTKELLLVTLESGDAEDDVEQTVSELQHDRVRCSVMCREAFLSDAFWALHPPKAPAGTHFTGADGAFIDVPWGFRFQWGNPNDFVLSGYAMFGLTRLAAATGGKVYLYYPPTGTGHTCCHHPYCECLFCEKDHQSTDEDVYQAQRLRAVAPLALPRAEVLARAVKDPWYGAVLAGWESALKEGLVYARPSVDQVGGTVRVEPHPYRGWVPLGGSAAFPSEASRAARLLKGCDATLRLLDAARAKAEAAGGEERWHAVADTFDLELRITRMNLLLYVAFCDEVGPEIARRRASSYAPPEVAPYGDDASFRWIGFENLSLCHGVAPFRAVRLPGGEETTRALRELEKAWAVFAKRWGHTPWAEVVRGMGLAKFYLVKAPGYVPPGARRIPDTATTDTLTLPERPSRPTRPGAGTSGGGGGPTTGG